MQYGAAGAAGVSRGWLAHKTTSKLKHFLYKINKYSENDKSRSQHSGLGLSH